MNNHRLVAATLLFLLLLLSACNAPVRSPNAPLEGTPAPPLEPTLLPPTSTPELELEKVQLDPCMLLEEEEVVTVLGDGIEMQAAAGTGGCAYIKQGATAAEMTQLIVSAAQGSEAKSLTLLSLGMLAGFSGDPETRTKFETLNEQASSLSLVEIVKQLADMLAGPGLNVELGEAVDGLTLWVVYDTEAYKQATLMLVQADEYVSINQVGSAPLLAKSDLETLATVAIDRLPPAFYVLDENGDGSFQVDLGEDTAASEESPDVTHEVEQSGLVWVTAANAGKLYAIDPGTNTVAAAIDIGRFPNDIAVLDDDVWVISETEGTLWRVDADRSEVVETIKFNGNTMHLAAGEGAVWIAGGLGVSKLDVESGTRYDVVFNTCYDVVLGGGSAWVSQNQDRQVLRIDPETRRVISTVRFEGQPTMLAYGHDRLWVVLFDKNEVVAVDPDSEEIINRLTSKYVIHGLAVDPDRIWFTTPFGAQYFKPATLGAGRLAITHPPSSLLYFAQSLWAASPNDGFLVRVDPEAMEVLEEIDLGTDPGALGAGE